MLEIVALSSHYGRIQALAGIDLKVEEGELVALVGSPVVVVESGS